jgi:gamma-tubulin complex component 5
MPPAAITALLLDTLLQAVQEYLSMVDMITSDTLMRVFAKTAEPVWSMVGQWLDHGMPVRDSSARYGDISLDEEFFIEDNEVMLLDPDFWADGYDLRDGTGVEAGEEHDDGPKTIPVFLAHVAKDVLGSGKATGLLRALGIPPTADKNHGRLLMNQSFSDLLALHTTLPTHTGQKTSVSLSTDTLSRLVYDELLPHCQATGALLVTVLVDDCDLWRHLSAIEDLYLMRRGDSMSHFTDLLFAKVRFSSRIAQLFVLLINSCSRWIVNNPGVTSTS